MKKVGIIVGRFQVPELHDGHKDLISSALHDFDRVIIFIGSTKNKEITKHDPIPYHLRKEMIEEFVVGSDCKIYELPDKGDWKLWVEDLDNKINELITTEEEAWICGSRDSMVRGYKENHGKYKTKEYTAKKELSGTKTREELLKNYKPTIDNKEIRKLLVYITGRK